MAYLHARSGIARSGVTYCGWTPPVMRVYIAGTNRSTNVALGEARVTVSSDRPATFAFTVDGITPAVGSDVKLTYATPNDYWFAGTLLQIQAAPEGVKSASLRWHCTAVGYEWLMDRYDLVRAQYVSRGVSTIVGDILATYTNGSFRVGYCPSSLGNLTMEFTFEPVSRCLERIAKAVGATWEITPDRCVNVFVTYPDAASATVGNSTVQAKTFRYMQDLTQVRTRVLYAGHGTTTTAACSASATTIDVADTGIFSSSGGSALSGRTLLTYTSTSTASGPGQLTGVTGIDFDIAENDPLDIIVEDTDSAADTALATLLGGGLSGQATAFLQDGRLSQGEAETRATQDLATFGGSLEEVSFTYVRPLRHLRPGRTLTLNITSPLTVSGAFTIQAVEIVPYGRTGEAFTNVFQTVSLSPYLRSLTTLLSKSAGTANTLGVV